MRAVFMGTPAFAVPSLERLAEAHEVALVITQPDRAAGRGGSPTASAIKQAAVRLGLPVAQPGALGGAATDRVARERPDVVCVVAFGMILPPDLLAIPGFGCLNVHASLLPRHRGAAPIQRAILGGDVVTGVSIMRMEEGLDTGPCALQREVPVRGRYADELAAELAEVGADALLDTLQLIEAGTAVWTPQDTARATYAAKITKDDVALEPALSAGSAWRRVRASTRRAPARACVAGRELTIVRATLGETTHSPGSVSVEHGSLVLGFSEGSLTLDVVRPSGRGDMAAADWVRGARLPAGATWRSTR